MVVKRRLEIVSQLIDEYGLMLSIKLVPSEKNLSAILTRVPKRWLQKVQKNKPDSKVVALGMTKYGRKVTELHNRHHLGVDRTMHVVSRMKIPVDRRVVSEIVKSCQMCKQIDPALIAWKHGSLDVEENWQRVAVDVAFVSGKPYLTVVDCGPSRFAI